MFHQILVSMSNNITAVQSAAQLPFYVQYQQDICQ